MAGRFMGNHLLTFWRLLGGSTKEIPPKWNRVRLAKLTFVKLVGLISENFSELVLQFPKRSGFRTAKPAGSLAPDTFCH